MTEGKTLRELNVQPGDVVQYIPMGGHSVIREWRDGRCYSEGNGFPFDDAADFRVVVSAALPPGHVRLASGEVVDLTANRVAHGLLEPEVRAAMEAHGGPFDIYTLVGWNPWQNYTINGKASAFHPSSVIRVRPAPAVRTVVTSGYGRDGEFWSGPKSSPLDTHRLTITLDVNGQPDCAVPVLLEKIGGDL